MARPFQEGAVLDEETRTAMPEVRVSEIRHLLALTLLPGLSPGGARRLCDRGKLPEVLARPADHADLLGSEARRWLASGRIWHDVDAEMARAARLGVCLVGLSDRSYPEGLRNIYDPPPALYVRGRCGPEVAPAVALVGARAASPAGVALARSMARELAASGLTVVSGLARGVDGAAHRGALDGRGRTVAVLGSGLDVVYPAEHAALAEEVAQQGAVVSEFPLGTRPHPGHFPRRNRIIAGWVRAVVVVEAAARSGALVTARAALDEGRDVLAVPGHPSQPGAEGVNQLLRDGAVLVRNAADVAEEMGWSLRREAGSETGDAVLSALKAERPQSLEEIQALCGWPLPEVLDRLGALELDRRVRRLPGALFVRT
jgi:DNA processing protein